MKKIILLIFLSLPVLLLAQYPSNLRKLKLGYQTTGDGLVFRGAGFPSFTPASDQNAYIYVDTTNNRYYYYSEGRWRKVSEEKYLYRQDETVGAAAVADSLLSYDRLFFAMELTSGASSQKAVQLPVTGLDSTYAGKVVRVSSMDSSGTYGIDVVASQPDGLALGDSLAILYPLTSGEVVEFQLYKYDSIYQWRLISSSIGGGGGGDGNGIISTLPATSVVIDANGNAFRIDSLSSLIFLANNAGNSARGRLVISGASTTPSDFGHVIGADTAWVRAIAQNANLESQIELKAEAIYKPGYISKATTTSFAALSGINSNGFEVKVHPDSIPKILALLDTVAALRAAIEAEQDTSQVLRDSIEDLRTAITALQSAGTSSLQYFENQNGVFAYELMGTDTTGLSMSKGSGTATITIPSGTKWFSVCFEGSDADIPIQDFSVSVNTTSTLLNTGASNAKPREAWIVARNSTNTAPSGSSTWIYDEGASPQRQLINISSGDNQIRFVNVKNAFDYWTICVSK